jgi:hypothetical protein
MQESRLSLATRVRGAVTFLARSLPPLKVRKRMARCFFSLLGNKTTASGRLILMYVQALVNYKIKALLGYCKS